MSHPFTKSYFRLFFNSREIVSLPLSSQFKIDSPIVCDFIQVWRVCDFIQVKILPLISLIHPLQLEAELFTFLSKSLFYEWKSYEIPLFLSPNENWIYHLCCDCLIFLYFGINVYKVYAYICKLISSTLLELFTFSILHLS